MKKLLNISDLNKNDFNEIMNYAQMLDKKSDNSITLKLIGVCPSYDVLKNG